MWKPETAGMPNSLVKGRGGTPGDPAIKSLVDALWAAFDDPLKHGFNVSKTTSDAELLAHRELKSAHELITTTERRLHGRQNENGTLHTILVLHDHSALEGGIAVHERLRCISWSSTVHSRRAQSHASTILLPRFEPVTEARSKDMTTTANNGPTGPLEPIGPAIAKPLKQSWTSRPESDEEAVEVQRVQHGCRCRAITVRVSHGLVRHGEGERLAIPAEEALKVQSVQYGLRVRAVAVGVARGLSDDGRATLRLTTEDAWTIVDRNGRRHT